MQERKYRGISYETNTFVYGWLHQTKYESSKYFIRTFPNEDDDYVDVVVDKNTIGQEIGLKDKYGVEIFEGDIVNNGESENLIVLWSDYYQSFIIDEKIGIYGEQSDDRLYDCDDIEEYEPFKYKCVSYEVIGNIHENPGLLEEK